MELAKSNSDLSQLHLLQLHLPLTLVSFRFSATETKAALLVSV